MRDRHPVRRVECDMSEILELLYYVFCEQFKCEKGNLSIGEASAPLARESPRGICQRQGACS
eukprot:355257-Alexandrium_andersonii.AAC.1